METVAIQLEPTPVSEKKVHHKTVGKEVRQVALNLIEDGHSIR